MADTNPGEDAASDVQADVQPDADNTGVSTQAPAEGDDDVSPPAEGSPQG